MGDSGIIPFLKYSQTDKRYIFPAPAPAPVPAPTAITPTLSLSLELLSSSGTLIKNGKSGILLTLHRPPNDNPNKPCIFYWSSSKDGFGPDGFALLHHTTDGHLEQVEIEKPQRFETPNFPEISAHDHSIHQLSPGGCDRWFQKIPGRYRDVLIPGERYELVWSGGGAWWWDWGAVEEREGEMRDSRPSLLVIPGGPRVSFTAVGEGSQTVPVQVSLPRLTESPAAERVPGAPILSVTLTGPSQKYLDENMTVNFIVTYHGIAKEEQEEHT